MQSISKISLLLYIIHFLADFHLQSEDLAERKYMLKGYLQHLLIHLALLLVFIFLHWDSDVIGQSIILALVVLAGHAFFDGLKSFLNKRLAGNSTRGEKILFLADQIFHLAWIYIFSEIVIQYKEPSLIMHIERKYLLYLLLLLLITKPANVAFKLFFAKYQLPASENTEEEIEGAGALIGNLERMLSAIFLAGNHITAIGLVYTAKSICRFKQIEDNKRFAEYYLIGTLYSILYVVLAYYIIIAGVLES